MPHVQTDFNLSGANSPPLAAVSVTVPKEPLREAANTLSLGPTWKFIDNVENHALLACSEFNSFAS